MAAKIITIAQQKGGAGKTTLAAQIAVAFAADGKRVVLVDIDPQASLADWHRLRNGAQVRYPLDMSAVAGYRVSTELSRVKSSYDIVIVDSPPHAETEAKLAIRAADLVLIPVQLSPMDIWATGPTVQLARAAGVPVLLVLNRVPPRANIVQIMRAQLAEKELPVAQATIGNRVAFAESMLEGLTVLESDPRSTAAAEIDALKQEIAAQL
jgi:chromosome partitioning protein